ncbi:hypothetical protein C8D87_11451 [Lentzea atacamensis]|uniref:Uncharacterized protein n=1 Tax=Lentzea atacamensis TaxID=531938 RepID=A0ABX9DVW4_9PSEU|nr:hypothetical protein [Lentzea atacamensis]RAS59439.1 hypothetical protein C8D87_11451 [Lentzea atacamensis]
MSGHSGQGASGTAATGSAAVAAVAGPEVPPESELEQTRPIRALSSWMLLRYAVRRRWRSWFRAGRGTQGLVVVLLLALAAVLLRSPQPAAETADPAEQAAPATATWKPPPPLPAWATARAPVAAQQDPAAITPRTPTDQELSQLPKAVVGTVLPAAPADPEPGVTPGMTVLHPTRDVAVYAEPGGCAVAVLPALQMLTPSWVPVIDRTPGWVLVMLPVRPHPGGAATVGWIHLTPDVELAERDHRIDIDTTNGRVSVLAELAHAATTSSTLGTVAPASSTVQARGQRSFVAVSGHTEFASWLLRLWLLRVDASRVCTESWTAVSVPGLPGTSPLGKLDHDGCVPTPSSLHAALSQIPAGTVVTLR